MKTFLSIIDGIFTPIAWIISISLIVFIYGNLNFIETGSAIDVLKWKVEMCGHIMDL